MKRSRTPHLALAVWLTFVAGCYDRIQHGDETIYQFSWWTGIAVFLGCIAGFGFGLLLRRNRFGWALLIGCPIIMVMATPAMYSDRVTVDQQHFTARYGMWFSPNVKDVRFADVRNIQIVEKRDSRNRASYEMHLHLKSGAVEILHLGTLVRNAQDDILAVARSHNIPVDPGPRR